MADKYRSRFKRMQNDCAFPRWMMGESLSFMTNRVHQSLGDAKRDWRQNVRSMNKEAWTSSYNWPIPVGLR